MIGIFDSGIGGLSVLAAVHKRLPHISTIYVADSAYCPYGEKTPRELISRTKSITRLLTGKGAELVVVACNTATVAAIHALRESFTLPFVGTVPAIKPAARASKTKRIGVIATRLTSKNTLTTDLIARWANHAKVITVGSPKLVTAVERAMPLPKLKCLIASELAPLLAERIDVLVLGSTHFALIAPVIRSVVGCRVQVIETGDAVAAQTARVWTTLHRTEKSVSAARTHDEYLTSGSARSLEHAAATYLHRRVHAHRISFS